MAVNTQKATQGNIDFATGKVSRVLIKFAIPAIISLFVAELYNMVDTIFVGRAIGATAIGALTIAFPIQRLMSSLGLLIAVGASTIVARSLGEGNYKKISKVIINSLSIMVLIMSTLIIGIYVFKNPIIKGLGATDNIYPFANDYIRIVVIGGIFQGFTLITGYILTALGNARINLVATSIGAICNVIIDFLLVIIFPLGVTGAAIATVTSQIISSVFALYHFLRVKGKLNLSLSFNMDRKISSTIIAVGFSTFIVEISDAVVAVVLNNMLVPYGDIAIVIVGVISKVSMFMYITIIGISSAMQPIAAFNYGARNYKRVKEVAKKSKIATWVTSIVIWAVMMVFAAPIIGSFVREQDILMEAIKAFRIVISIFPCIGSYFVAIYYYQAIGEAKISLLLSIYRQLLIFIPVVVITTKYFGMLGTWIAYPLSDMISAVTGIYYMRKARIYIDEDIMEERKIAERRKLKEAYGNGRIGRVTEA